MAVGPSACAGRHGLLIVFFEVLKVRRLLVERGEPRGVKRLRTRLSGAACYCRVSRTFILTSVTVVDSPRFRFPCSIGCMLPRPSSPSTSGRRITARQTSQLWLARLGPACGFHHQPTARPSPGERPAPQAPANAQRPSSAQRSAQRASSLNPPFRGTYPAVSSAPFALEGFGARNPISPISPSRPGQTSISFFSAAPHFGPSPVWRVTMDDGAGPAKKDD